MELVQKVDASDLLSRVDGMTMWSSLDATAGLDGFGSTTLWSNDLDMFDRMDASGAGTMRQPVTDYSMV
jgi:hypothetical protein